MPPYVPSPQELDLWRKILGGTAPTGAASSSGDVSQMVKYLIANPPSGATPASVRNVYVPNLFDSWGFLGWEAQVQASTGTTDPANLGPRNLTWCGYISLGTGSIGYTTANPLGSSRNRILQLTVNSGSGNNYGLQGRIPMGSNSRIIVPGIPDYSSSVYTSGQWICEALVVPDSTANNDIFIGLGNQNDPFTVSAGAYCTGACYSAAIDGNWRALNNNNGTVSTDKTAGTVAASTAAMQLVKVVVTATSVTVTVNGTVVSSAYTTNFPGTTGTIFPLIQILTRTAANKLLYIERAHDWVA